MLECSATVTRGLQFHPDLQKKNRPNTTFPRSEISRNCQQFMMSNSDTEEIYPTESHCLQLVHLMLTIDGVRRHITSPSFISVLNQHNKNNTKTTKDKKKNETQTNERFQL